jgi:hypothetical protein
MTLSAFIVINYQTLYHPSKKKNYQTLTYYTTLNVCQDRGILITQFFELTNILNIPNTTILY